MDKPHNTHLTIISCKRYPNEAFLFLGGLQDFTLGIVSYVFVVNAATFLGLLVLYSLVLKKAFQGYSLLRARGDAKSRTWNTSGIDLAR